jgi:ligand-binding sensor domain-containing protein/signal transduction histidine kinase
MELLNRLVIVLLLIICFRFESFAQDIAFEHVSVEKGLSSTSVYAFAQTEEGFLWIGTQNGLNRFDGYNFKIFNYVPGDAGSLANNWVKALITDKAGNLWVGTSNGLSRYNNASETFTTFLAEKHNDNTLAANNIWGLYEDRDGVIWIGTDNGLTRYSPRTGKFKSFRIPSPTGEYISTAVNTIVEGPDGSLLIGTWGRGIYKFDKEQQTFSSVILPLPQTASNRLNVKVLKLDGAGRLWIGTQSNGIILLDPAFKTAEVYTNSSHPNSISDNYILSVYEDKTGKIWVGTYGQGVCLFDPESKGFIRYQSDELNPRSLQGNWVTSLFEDNSGVMWLGHDNGISRFNLRGPKFRLFKNNPLDSNSIPKSNINIVYEDSEGLLWFGMWGGGLSRFNPADSSFTHYQHDPKDHSSLIDNRVWGICEDSDGQLWVATSSGLQIFNKRTWRFRHYKDLVKNRPDLQMKHRNLSYIMADKKGRMWIGTWGDGLYVYDQKGSTLKHLVTNIDDAGSLAGNRIRHIYEDSKGTIWIATSEGGLDKVTEAKDERLQFQHFQYSSTEAGSLGSNSPMIVYEDSRGRLWVGTDGSGLNLLDNKTGKFANVKGLLKNGLNNVLGILEDKEGLLWLSTNNGLARYEPSTEQLKIYDVSDGLQSNSFLYGHCKTGSGQMIFGGHSGFNIFFPGQIKDSDFKPKVILSDLRLFNEPVEVGKPQKLALKDDEPILQKPLAMCSDLVLSYKDYVLSFGFASLDFTAPHKNRYAYMLENFENHWNYTDAGKRYATYTNLKPGEYIFRVRGTNSDGVWSDHVASLKVKVTPPFWDTWWFKLLITIIVLLSVFLVHRIWLQLKLENLLAMERMKIEEAENIRKRVAMDFHDEMGNQLASMTALINLINLRRSKNDYNFDDLLLKLNQNAQNLFYGTRDFIWSINPKSDKAEEVLLNIKDFAEDLFSGSGITFHFDNCLTECGVILPPGSSRHITLICKEIFTNCMKHARCSNVRLSCRYENNVFSLTIKDDGKGFLKEELKRDCNGLQNIKSRARKIGASVEVVSALLAGTTITVELLIPKKGE